MILILNRHPGRLDELATQIRQRGVEARVLDLKGEAHYAPLFSEGITAAVIENDIYSLSSSAAAQINQLGRKLPVLFLDEGLSTRTRGQSPASLENITLLGTLDTAKILATLAACGVLGPSGGAQDTDGLALYSPHISSLMLTANKATGILCVDATDLRKIEIENGFGSYARVRTIFERILLDMRGKRGCLRKTDVLCRHPDSSNHYLVFLRPSRITSALPMPGDVERVADRLSVELQNVLWKELTSETNRKAIPDCVGKNPSIFVGFTSVIDNPCLDSFELVNEAVHVSSSNVEVQAMRMRARQRELIQYLIHSADLLTPHFQAVFRAAAITKTNVNAAREASSLSPLAAHLFGFESLIRVSSERVSAALKSHTPIIEPKLLGPDVLFSLAKATNISLELDQACLLRAVKVGKVLPGNLLINILPRNLYHFDRLIEHPRTSGKIILEVSESEPITNLPLMREALSRAPQKNVDIAADDFGKDHAGLSRVIDIKPSIIKFDRNLVHNIQDSPAKQAYLKGVIVAAKQLKADVIAEGVETWEEMEVLQKMGVDFVQGFLLHRPQSVDVILRSLSSVPVAEAVAPSKAKSESRSYPAAGTKKAA